MPSAMKAIQPNYIINDRGHKTAVVINLKDYENLLDFIEDIEDTNDLLTAERQATDFLPYDDFRKKWLKP